MSSRSVPSFSQASPLMQFFLSSLLIFGLGIVFQLVATFLASITYGFSFQEVLQISQMESEVAISALKFVQIVGSFGTFIFSSLLLSLLYTGSWVGIFEQTNKVTILNGLILVIVMITILPFINFMTELNLKLHLPFEALEHKMRLLHEQMETLTLKMVSAGSFWALLVNMFMIAVIPAIGEELVFRGLLQKHLVDWLKRPHLAVFLTAALFSITHLQLFAFFPRFMLGLILGYSYFYGKNIWYPILAHFVNNAMGVVFYYFILGGNDSIDSLNAIEEVGTATMLPILAFISLVVSALLLYYWINQFPRPDREGKA